MNEPRIFLVRVWSDARHFRASARDAGEEEMQWFETPEQMVAFLARPADGPAPPAAGPTNGGPVDDDERR